MRCVIPFAALLVAFSTAHSTTWYVHPDSALNSIQAGIDSSVRGDTVLVSPATYVENINFNGKNIVLGSLFLTTGGTSYVRSTIIDGDSSGSVVTFESGEDSIAILTGFTIQNGYAQYGGGIHCETYANPTLTNIIISGNAADYDGGGVYCDDNSNLTLINTVVSGNRSRQGGGIYCYDSSPSLTDVLVEDNTSGSGGGIYCYDSSPSLSNVTVTRNTAQYHGGGIYCFLRCSPSFDALRRGNVFLNSAQLGSDLYATERPTIHVVVDTFTVLSPSDYFVYPTAHFSFDILNSKIPQVNQDLYVSPVGSDSNSGTAADDPLLTISHAIKRIIADSANPHTIHLANGVYSPSLTGESFPLYCRSYLSLQGEDESLTILDGEDSLQSWGGIFRCFRDTALAIENMTIQNGNAVDGGGILLSYSSPSLTNLIITENTAQGWHIGGGSGAGICCYDSSSPSLTNVLIHGNTSYGWPYNSYGGGIACWYNSSPSLVNVTISQNTAHLYGGGIHSYHDCNPVLVDCILWGNSPEAVVGSLSASYSDIQGGWPGTGNIDLDPSFTDTANGDFSLTQGSPCIDAGTPDTTGLGLPPWDILGNHRIWDGDGNGSAIIDMGAYEYGSPPVRVEERVVTEPPAQILLNCFPNPSTPHTTIRYSLAEATHVTLTVHNALGQEVRRLVEGCRGVGVHEVVWNGHDDAGRRVPSGSYFLRLQTEDNTATKKIMVLR